MRDRKYNHHWEQNRFPDCLVSEQREDLLFLQFHGFFPFRIFIIPHFFAYCNRLRQYFLYKKKTAQHAPAQIGAKLRKTKAVRRKLQGAYSDASPIVAAFHEGKDPVDIMMINSADRAIIFKSSLIPQKTTRTAGGVALMTLKKGQKIVTAKIDLAAQDDKGYRKYKLPATGTLLAEKDISAMQLKIE